MPTRDYDPINELIEAIHKTSVSTWPTIKGTTDAEGNVFISRGNPDSYVATAVTKAHKPIKLIAYGSLPIIEEKPVDPFAIRSVLSNRKKNAFSVVWEDGTTTVVHCQPGDEWDDEKALAMCFTKKALGNKGNFNDKFNDALDNKMKVIKNEKEVAKEVADMWKETLRDPINGQLTIDDTPANDTNEEEKSYELYLVGSFTNVKRLVHRGTIGVLRDFIKRYAVKADLGYYFRTWNADGGMYLDYGSYTQYFFIPGITNSEYAGK